MSRRGRYISTAVLRPFFSPSSSDLFGPWNPDPTSLYLHGATPGRGQEMSGATHPHLELGQSMVSIPKVEPGDGVFWHGDLIHAYVGQPCRDRFILMRFV